MNSEIQKNVQSSQQISWIFDTQNVLFWLGVLYFAVILLNRPGELAGVRDIKPITLPRPTSLCHSCLSLSGTMITQHCIQKGKQLLGDYSTF